MDDLPLPSFSTAQPTTTITEPIPRDLAVDPSLHDSVRPLVGDDTVVDLDGRVECSLTVDPCDSEDERITLGVALYPPGSTKAVAKLDWSSRSGRMFRGTILRGPQANHAFGTIGEMCAAAGVETPASSLTGWTFGLAFDPSSNRPTAQPLVESDGRFDARALRDRIAAFAATAQRTFAPTPAPASARPRVSMLQSFMVPAASWVAKPPLPLMVTKERRSKARTRAIASSLRPADPVKPPRGARVPSGTTIASDSGGGKRSRGSTNTQTDAVNASSAECGPVQPEHASAFDMFFVWYQHHHDEYRCHASARDAWDSILPPTNPNRNEKWCRSYWKRLYAKEARDAYNTRCQYVLDDRGHRTRVDTVAPDVCNTPTVDDLAMTFYSDTRGGIARGVTNPHSIVYAQWDQGLLDRWFRRSTRWDTFADDPALDAIAKRRWVMGNHARYLCAWALPNVGVNARRIVRAQTCRTLRDVPGAPRLQLPHGHESTVEGRKYGDEKSCAIVETRNALADAATATPPSSHLTEKRMSWHAAVTLCQNPRYAAAVAAYEASLRARAFDALEIFLERMKSAGHGDDVIDMLRVEVRIALYGLGILDKRTDGPPPKSLCVFAPGYSMKTREHLMSAVPRPPVRGPTTQPTVRETDARRAFQAIMCSSTSSNDNNDTIPPIDISDVSLEATGARPPAATTAALSGASHNNTVDDEVRSQRRLAIERGTRVKRLVRREWNRVERRNLLSDVEVDTELEEDDDGNDRERSDTMDSDGDSKTGTAAINKPKIKVDPFWSGVERRMRLMDLVDD